MPVVIFKQTKEQRTVTKKREIERECVGVCVQPYAQIGFNRSTACLFVEYVH